MKDIYLDDKWKENTQDKLSSDIRTTYNLNKDSIVFDLGCNIGEFSASINEKYGSHIYAFDISSISYLKCIERFSDIHNIRVFHYGIGAENKVIKFYLTKGTYGDVSQFLEPCRRRLQIDGSEIGFIVDIKTFMDLYHITHINLLKINIEGGEYDFLEHLIKQESILNSIHNIQISFHNKEAGVDVLDYNKRRIQIQEELSKTHNLEWCYPYVHESWRLK